MRGRPWLAAAAVLRAMTPPAKGTLALLLAAMLLGVGGAGHSGGTSTVALKAFSTCFVRQDQVGGASARACAGVGVRGGWD